jgi:hypothetical protein
MMVMRGREPATLISSTAVILTWSPMGEWDSRPQSAVGGGTWADSH